MTAAWTIERRDALMSAHDEAVRVLRAEQEATKGVPGSYPRIAPLLDAVLGATRAYWDALPRLALSACPHCGQALRKAFDPLGLEGYFWQEAQEREVAEPAPCPHFAVLQGAVHLEGLAPRGGPEIARPGPEVPFVIPRLLALPGMIAVVSRVPLDNGYTAYPIAYFADPRPPGNELTQSWTRTTYDWPDEKGRPCWSKRDEEYDYELAPWVERGLLRWIEPGDASWRVVAAPARCPYVDLPGRRAPVTIKGDRLYGGGVVKSP